MKFANIALAILIVGIVNGISQYKSVGNYRSNSDAAYRESAYFLSGTFYIYSFTESFLDVTLDILGPPISYNAKQFTIAATIYGRFGLEYSPSSLNFLHYNSGSVIRVTFSKIFITQYLGWFYFGELYDYDIYKPFLKIEFLTRIGGDRLRRLNILLEVGKPVYYWAYYLKANFDN